MEREGAEVPRRDRGSRRGPVFTGPKTLRCRTFHPEGPAATPNKPPGGSGHICASGNKCVGAIPRGRPGRRRGALSPFAQRKGTRSPRDRHKNAGVCPGRTRNHQTIAKPTNTTSPLTPADVRMESIIDIPAQATTRVRSYGTFAQPLQFPRWHQGGRYLQWSRYRRNVGVRR